MNILITSEFSQLDSSKTHEILSLVTLKAPVFVQEADDRAPLDLIAVLDVSGSMSGDKIRMMRDTMSFAIKQLQAKDRLGIVLFESSVSVLLPLIQMTADAKERATTLVEKIRDLGSTALAGGLEKGYDILIEDSSASSHVSDSSKVVTSILLFTDGQANVGLQSSSDIVNMMKTKQTQLTKKSTSVFTFGYGSDHSVELLKSIAEAGSGMYYYVEDEEKIATAFGDCLGGLLSVAAQNLELKLHTPDTSIRIKKVFGSTKQTGGINVNSNHYSTELGDIYSEEERNVLVLLEVGMSQTHEQVLLECELKGFDVVLADTFDVKRTLKVIRDQETKKDVERSGRIEDQRNRLLTVDAVDEARKLANQNNLEKARQVLQEAIKTIKNSPQKDSVITQQMIKDLEESLNDMKDKNLFKEVGNQKMAMCSRSHQTERGNHSTPMYSNASKYDNQALFMKNVKK